MRLNFIQKLLNLLLCLLAVLVSALPHRSSAAENPDTLSFFQNQSLQPGCAEMFVDISTACLVPCTNSDYFVRYCNFGDITATDAFVVVEFDSTFTVNGASLPFANQAGNVFIFTLGDVQPGECGSFSINIGLDCDAVPGQAHCVDAQIYPSPTCDPPPGNWDGSNIEVNINCAGDSIYFYLQNTGAGNMNESSQFIIIEDDVIVMLNGYYLPAGGDTTFVLPNNGGFYHFEAGQTGSNPHGYFASSNTEGCNVVTPGYLNQFPASDEELSYEQSCITNDTVCRSNIKIAFPIGVGDMHTISPNQQLQYQINFQNTSMDTVNTVIVCDTLSSFLDASTLIGGASNFDYSVQNIGNNIIKFQFENIDLPPDGTGFVKFQVEQIPDNPNCAVIENWARIFFDQDSILTDTVFHTILCDSIITDSTIIFCGGGGYYNGVFYSQSTSLTNTTNFSFGTSVLNTTIYVYPGTPDEVVYASICEGESYEFHGHTYNASGTYEIMLTDSNGCPYTMTLVLTVIENVETIIYRQICQGEVFTFFGQNYVNSGTYSHVQPNGECYDIDILVLTVNPSSQINENAAICEGDTLVWHGEVLTNDTIVVHHYNNQYGCGSDSVLVLTVHPNYIAFFDASICEGEVYQLGNNALTMPGVYTDTLQSVFGCDSIVTVNLTVLPVSSTGLAAVICQGDSYQVGDAIYTESGTYVNVLTAANGCDSIVTLELIVQAKDSVCFAEAGPDTLICGFAYNLIGRPSAGDWQVLCNASAGFAAFEATNDSTAIVSVSACGTYYFKYTHLAYDSLVVFDSILMVFDTVIDTCVASDLVRVDFEDPSYQQQNVNLDIALIYNDYTCQNDDGVTCGNVFMFDQIPPVPSWKFNLSAACMSHIVHPEIGDTISDCLVENIDINEINSQDSLGFPLICTGQDLFAELDSAGQTVIHDGYFDLLDSLFGVGLNGILNACPPIGGKCFAQPPCTIDTLGFDTVWVAIPIHLGGYWTYIDAGGSNIPLQDTSILEIDSQAYALIITPNAHTYSPVNFELWQVSGPDSLMAPASAVSLMVQWKEIWVYDSIRIIKPILGPLPDSCLPVCPTGGLILTSTVIPPIPTFDCPPFTITFEGTTLVLTDSVLCDTNAYQVEITILGGTPPYMLEGLGGHFLSTNLFLSDPIPLNMGYMATVTDSAGCTQTIIGETCRCNMFMAESPMVLEATCTDSCVVLVGTVTGPAVGWSAQWCAGNLPISNGITATVCHAGTYLFKITELNSGCMDSSFTTVNIAFPVAEAGPDMELSCNQPMVVLQGDELSGVFPISYNWQGPSIDLNNATLQMPTVTQPGLYILTVTNLATGCMDMDSVLVHENEAMPHAIIEAPILLNCYHPSQTLSAINSTPSGHIGFHWSTSQGNIVSGEGSPYTLIDEAGIYYLVITELSSGCTDTAEIVVQADLTPPQQVNAGENGQLDCAHDSLALNGSVLSMTHLSIAWTSPDGHIVAGQYQLNPVIDAPGTYWLTVQDTINGCIGEDQVEVTEDYDYPFATIAWPDTLNCADTLIVLSGAGSSNDSNMHFQWLTIAGHIVSGENNINSMVNAPGTYFLSVMDSGNGCISIDTVEVAQNTVLPIADAGLDRYFSCSADSLRLDAGNSSAGFNIKYQWHAMAGNQNNLGNTINPWIYEPDVYVLTVLDETNRCISTDTVMVEAYSPVSFDLVMAPDCQNSDVGSVSVVNLVGQASFYVFELDNGSVRYDSLFTGLSAGNYTLTVRDPDSCAVQMDFTIAEIPALPPQVFEKTYHFCGADNPLTLDVTANIDPQWVSYFWSNGMDTPQIAITEEGDYSVEVLTGCDSYTYSFEVVDDLKRASLFAMPNAFSPNQDGWNDDFGPVAFNELGEYKLLVFDRWGEKVFESSDTVKNWDGNYKGKPAAADVYIWKVVAKYDDCIEQPHQFSLKGNVTLLR